MSPHTLKCLAPAIGTLAAIGMATAGDSIVCFEAESATNVVAPMQVSEAGKPTPGAAWQPVKDASKDRYIEVPQGKGNPPEVTTGQATWSFELQDSGTYYLWCRVWWGDECSNSLTVQIDDGTPFSFGQDSTYKSWHWVKAPPRLRQLKLTDGTHGLTIRNREDGVRVDQIFLTDDRGTIPVGVETVTQQPAEQDK